MAKPGEAWVPLNEQQRADTIDLGFYKQRDYRREHTKKLRELQIEHARKGQPYDYRAAKLDFEKEQNRLYRRDPKAYDNERTVPIEKFDYDHYGKKGRFLVQKEKSIRKVLGSGETRREFDHKYVTYISKGDPGKDNGGARYTIEVREPVADDKDE